MESKATPTSRLLALDFAAELRRLTADFTGRAWVFDKIDRWLKDVRGASLFLLTGEPGVGKSAIAARVVQTRSEVAAYHFCIAGRNETIVPATVLRSLAAQMGDKLPGYGTALANTIQPTHLTVNVNIDVQTMTGGQITGVVINHLTVLDPQTELEVLLRAPLAALPAPEQPQLVVIDSLDEAATLRSDSTVVTLLAGADGLPGWLRIFCTSRPDRRVLREFDRLNPATLAAESRLNLDDIRQYVTYRVSKPALAQRLLDAGQAEGPFSALLSGPDNSQDAGLAGGNFLFAKMLLNDVEAGQQSLANMQALPRSLDGIYHNFLRRFSTAEWEERYQPLFGVLVAALEPLTEAQIARFSGEKRTFLRQNLGILRQFLDVSQASDGSETFRLFHRSLRDYLTNETRSQDFWCAPEDYHQQIVDSYLERDDQDWSACDDYGLRQLPQHLSLVGNLQRLSALLLEYRWLQAKLDRTDIRALITDAELALADATWSPSDQEALSLLQRALRLSAHILAVDKLELAGQLIGRLSLSNHPSIWTLREEARQQTAHPWLRPVTSALLQATSPIVFVLSSHTHPVRAVALTRDGKRALSAAEDRTLKVWDVETGEDLHTLRGHTDSVLAVAVDPDGRFAVSGSQDKTMRVWDLETAEQVLCIEAHDQAVSAVAITPDGLQIVSGSYDATVKLWDLKTGVYCKTLHGHASGVNALALTPDGSRLVSGSYDRTLKLWDLESSQVIHTFHGHQDQVNAVAISPEGRWMASASFDRTLKLWDLETKSELHTFSGHNDVVTSVAIGPDGRIVSASWDTTLRVWDSASRALIGVLEGHSFRVHGIAITPDGQRAISASGDTTLNVWDLTAPLSPPAQQKRDGSLKAVTVTPDGRYAVCWREQYTRMREQYVDIFEVWDLQAALLVDEAIGYLDYRRADLHLHTAFYGQPLQVRDPASGIVETLTLSGWMSTKTLFPPGGQPLGFHDLRTKVVRLVAPDSGETVRAFQGHTSNVFDVALTPDGTRLLTTSDDRTVGVWELASGRNVAFLRGHSREVWSVGVAGDSRTAVTSSDDRSVIVWDLEQLQPIARFSADGALTACAITPDGKTVVTGDEAGRMHILRLEGLEYYGCEGILS